MDIDDFLDINKPIKRNVVPGLMLNAHRPSTSCISEPLPKREKLGKDFAKSVKADQDDEIMRKLLTKRELRPSNMMTLDDDNEAEFKPKFKEQREIYGRYKFNSSPFNPNLPIHQYRDGIVRRVRECPILIIKGETGCGKSTQVPQFILDDAYHKNEYCNIIITQPRRIAALSLAEQVSRERGCELSTLVGCHIGLDRKTSDDTRLTYCTTGVLLQKLVQAKRMNMYTHIILDEIHERDEEMEFLLITIKRFMIKDHGSTKIILMSATIDTDEFAQYFRLPRSNGGWVHAPSIDLEQDREFVVKQLYLDDIQRIQDCSKLEFKYESPGIHQELYRLAAKLIAMHSNATSTQSMCILVFLPGIHEITTLQNILEEENKRLRQKQDNTKYWKIMVLHSTVKDQQCVFLPVGPDTIKIILATNIAESSITVPDVKIVIDFCLARSLEVDQDTGFASLRLKWASKSSCKQRAGRAGRTTHGLCYRLIYKDFFEGEIRLNETPAMLRCSLEKIVLKAKMLDEDVPPANIIGLAINPPDLTDIKYTVMNLKEARGLHLTVNRKYVDDDGDITFIGRVMDALPIDFRASRLIVMGYIFNMLEECVIIAAGITVQKLFINDFEDPLKTFSSKLTFADGSGSDLFAMLHAYKYFERKIFDKHFHMDQHLVNSLERHCLDHRALNEIYQLKNEIFLRLEPFALKENDSYPLTDYERNLLLKVCICGAFYPNYFLRASKISLEDTERTIFHELNGRDPCNTIYYRGIGYEQMGMLYQNQVKAYLRDRHVISSPDDVKISFDKGVDKMFVTFLGKQELIDGGSSEKKPMSDWMPGKICTPIYKVIKLARERKYLVLNVMEKQAMEKYADSIGAGHYNNGVFIPRNINVKHDDLCALPDIYTKSILGRVTSITTPNKFWIRPLDRNEFIFDAIKQALNRTVLAPITELSELKGKLVAVFVRNEEARFFGHPKSYHRARVITDIITNGQHRYQVHLIDEGEDAFVDISLMRSLDGVWIRGRTLGLMDDNKIYLADIPPRVFEATLAEIRPSYVISGAGKWTPDGVQKFKNLLSDENEINIEIYSIWNGVVSVILYNKEKESINKILLKDQLAHTCEESYPSKYDHAIRFNVQNFEKRDTNAPLPASQEIMDYLKEFYTVPLKPPPAHFCTKKLNLKAPISPLETTVHSTFRSAIAKNINIDRLSVNCVLLDTDPQDPTERLVVAANIASFSNRNELSLRNTTIMPNIHGFAQLMAMLFAPKVELHRDITETRYASLLCGLGYNRRKNTSLFPEHDLIMRFDCYMDQSDMLEINKLRYTMSALLHVLPGQKVPDLKPDDRVKLKKESLYTLIKLLQKDRKFIDDRMHNAPDHVWGSVKEEELQIVEGTQIYGDQAIFPAFTFMKLENESPEQIELYRNNNQELHALVFCKVPLTDPIDCLLCSKTFTKVNDIRTHLFTKLHRDRAEQCHAKFQLEHFRPERAQRYF
uniref:CSON007297 protein n=1 Tax=Culicoides sonorensis TaxID=179676 RepID=A0A336MVA3_CULSO